MTRYDRRSFLRLGAASAGAAAALGLGTQRLAGAADVDYASGRDFSPDTGVERKMIPSACWQCVARDGIVCFVEDGRLVKIEGNPKLPRTRGRLCAKGQAGVNQVYDPDRLLYPMRRVGPRGGGRWRRITWDEALDEIADRLKALHDAGTPEKFMFHYGRMKGSTSKIVKDYFLTGYGTKTVGNHTSICEGGKWTSQELVWGKHYDVNDVSRSDYILNFGCNMLEAHTSHVPFSQRVVDALGNGAKLVTFDVRLSNTAAKSAEWHPVLPGTDGLIALAMCNVIIQRDELVDKEFIETWANVTVDELKDHLSQYTLPMAERASGVAAADIERIALEFARTERACVVSYRGTVAHFNGVENERAMLLLDAICGNIDVEGGRCKAVGASWKNSFKKPSGHPGKLSIIDGPKGEYAAPTHHANHQVLKMIKDGSAGRPDIYMIYCYNPVYVTGEVRENEEVLKDESLIPMFVSIDVAFSESTALADIILPAATYLERWDWEDMVSYDQIPEYYIRQPVVEPLGEVRPFTDVACDLAKRIGGEVAEAMPFGGGKAFVQDACDNTPGVREAGGFTYMCEQGAWVDPDAKPKYRSYAKALSDEDVEGAIVDKDTGVIWKGEAGKKYADDKDDYKLYVGQMVNGAACAGFKPDKVPKSGLFEIRSDYLLKKHQSHPIPGLPDGWNGLPTYMPIPEHIDLGNGRLILTTFKVNVQTHSRTQNCKYLTEIYHDNPAWINSATAAELGISDGDDIRVRSSVGELVTKAKVTEGVHPNVIAISYHCGHWQYGRYASGKAAPTEGRGDREDPDLERIWWDDRRGVHPNPIIPNAGDPIAGQMRWMDTVVTVERA